MNDDIDKKMKRLMDEIDDDMGPAGNDNDIYQGRGSANLKKILIIGGVVFLVLIALVFVFPRGNNMLFNGRLNSIEAKLKQSEEKLGRSVKEEIDKLAEKIETLEKKKIPAAGKTEKSRVSRKQKEQTFSAKKRYHVIRKGENLYRISLLYGISVEKLCRLNVATPVKTGVQSPRK
ncbi:MAG: hypothetical protein B1H13_10475 [Desulfobacteraceae bacterium 4484_190.3]|nr:MAG: hypothetical protein B1H13_10475 [Desulfobacteraceae bacterium 4484_190.3]